MTQSPEPTNLILASTSVWRRELLRRLGIEFECRSPAVDEDEWKSRISNPEQLAEELATAKARSVAADEPDAAVIGSDQLVVLDDRILGKPGNRENAIRQLRELSGRSHRLITSLAVVCLGDMRTHTDVTTLSMRQLAGDEIARYVDSDDPTSCAGSYRIESLGITLFDRIESRDQSAIVGLPLMALADMLRPIGFRLP